MFGPSTLQYYLGQASNATMQGERAMGPRCKCLTRVAMRRCSGAGIPFLVMVEYLRDSGRHPRGAYDVIGWRAQIISRRLFRPQS